MQDFRLVALAPPGSLDPSIAIAASRAGGLGLLDLTLTADKYAARRAVDRMATHARGSCGIRLDPQSPLAAKITARLPEVVDTVVLAGDWTQSLELVGLIKRGGREVLLELTSGSELDGPTDEVDALIAKGNESGGRVGEETTFVLLQRLLAQTSLPVLAHGGIGLHTAAAVRAAGAAGVVLDAQLTLTRESPLPGWIRSHVARMDGSETNCFGTSLGLGIRCYASPAATAAHRLAQLAERVSEHDDVDVARARWLRAARRTLGWGSLDRFAWPLGQDGAMARELAEHYVTTGRVIGAMMASASASATGARRRRTLAEGAPLAKSHGTRYPIVQGPMTRVSDAPQFAAAVARAGALPFLSLALSRGPEVTALLETTRDLLGAAPWGAGILGFVTQELREEQLSAIRACPPPFGLVAGGRPDHAKLLEDAGIATYLHVPSPALLELFARSGARRFVFEGRECGGHVGPRSSFVLWDAMVATLLRTLAPSDLADTYILFAGGIHDGGSARMVAALSDPLAEQGARIGVLLGTAYLFTREIVSSGAMVKGFQEAALRCDGTALLESGGGHTTRCAQSPFVETFEVERRRLRSSPYAAEEVRKRLEQLNLGRLRIASKGLRRSEREEAAGFERLSGARQRAEGMYMMGQVAALRGEPCTVAQLHHDIAGGADKETGSNQQPALAPRGSPRPFDAAIIGMACLLPKAQDADSFWENILAGVDAVTEVPDHRWPLERYFDPDPTTPDKVYSKWGGFLDDVVFDPLRYGMPPASLTSIEPLQLLALEVARAALEDAGYLDRPFPRAHTSVIFGAGGGVADLGHLYAVRAGLPMVLQEVPEEALAALPEWTEDSFPGILLNVVAGRIANRFDLGGANYTVDAACASSLAAVQLAARELQAGTSDLVLVGGGDTVQNAFGYTCFSKTHALSPSGRCRTFDADADGIAISEGIGMLVLKRLADAQRDGDRVYAILKAVGSSSDGRERGLTAPRPEGQALALQRAYSQAGVSPATVGLVEAHGTGTVAGDQAEVLTLRRVFEDAGGEARACAIGSVKSQIGHTKCTAGIAGLIKAARALHHKVLPPTIHVQRPNPTAKFDRSPFYVNTEVRPWITGQPRRAGVSAFGFGGTNFHAVLEEYTDEFRASEAAAPARTWPAELLAWSAQSTARLLEAIEPIERVLAAAGTPTLRELACAAWERIGEGDLRMAIVATSIDDLRDKLGAAREALARGDSQLSEPRGIFLSRRDALGGRLAFLFPGQGSQAPGMLRELAVHFEEVRLAYAAADEALVSRLGGPLSRYVFPPPPFSDEERAAQAQALRATDIAQPALGSAAVGVIRLLAALGVHPALTAGHSYGEYVALHAAGALSEHDLHVLSHARGRAILEAADGHDLGTMVAAAAGAADVRAVLADTAVDVANLNAPRQTVLSGSRAAIATALQRLESAGIRARELPVACAFHSPLVAPARERLAAALATTRFKRPKLDVYANATAAAYPSDPAAIAAMLGEHLVAPVRFQEQVAAMYAAGTRIFVEAGPRAVLTGLVGSILEGSPHLAVAIDPPGREGVVGLLHALAHLFVEGVPIAAARLFAGRQTGGLDIDALQHDVPQPEPPPTAWLVNGGRARPYHGAERNPRPVPAAVSPARPAPQPLGPGSNGSHSDALSRHAELMRHFIDTQEAVMLAYLGHRPGSARNGEPRGVPPAGVGDGRSVPGAESQEPPSLPRLTLQADLCPAPPDRVPMPDGALLITDDGRGVAGELVARLSELNFPALVSEGEHQPQDLDAARTLIATTRERHGAIAGIVHLGALRSRPPFSEMDLDAWRTALETDLEPLLLLARAAASDLARDGVRLCAATSIGGTFGLEAGEREFDPRHGALAGFLKCAAAEWPSASVKTIDLDPADPASAGAEHVLTELWIADGELEVAWSGESRTVPRPRAAPLRHRKGEIAIGEGDVVLVTGGARGITAEIALELAERYRPRLVLAGRTALPRDEESPTTANLGSLRELRAALSEQLATRGRRAAPSEVEARCSQLLAAREIRSNLHAMRHAGAIVEYHQLDAGDPASVAQLVNDVYARCGRIDGVIHGAGIIEDALIVNKDVDSLRRVIAVKALGSIALSRAVRPHELRFFALFGSVAGRFGNRGQADYASANQVVSKLATYLDRRWPGRVVAIDWGPWSDVGMASADSGRRLEELGMRRIVPRAGRRAFADELLFGRKGEAEVVIGAGPWTARVEADRDVEAMVAL